MPKTSGVKDNSFFVAKASSNSFDSDSDSYSDEDWQSIASLAAKYAKSVGVVKSVVDTWVSFALGKDFQYTIKKDNKKLTKEKINELNKQYGINKFARNMVKQGLVKGNTTGLFDGTTLRVANSTNVKAVRDGYDIVTLNYQNVDENGNAGDVVVLDMETSKHIRFDAQDYEENGLSIIYPAFDNIKTMKAYQAADREIARQFETPFRYIQVGGYYGDKVYMPKQSDLDKYKEKINKMNPKDALIVPFHFKVHTEGIRESVPDTDKKIQSLRSDIIIDMGIAQSVVTGEGANRATVKSALEKFVIQLTPIQDIARDILTWAYFIILNKVEGYDLTEATVPIKFDFPEIDLSDREEYQKILIELYDRALISKKALQIRFDIEEDEEEKKNPDKVTSNPVLLGTDIINMVSMGILTVKEAREILGFNEDFEKVFDESEAIKTNRELYK